MHVNRRTFCHIVLTSLVLSAIGLLLDVDHAYYVNMGWPEGRWLHYTLASTPSLLILLSVFWGLIISSLALGWDHLENKALFLLSQEMKLEINRINQTTDDLLVNRQIL